MLWWARYPDGMLPNTGVSIEQERALSSCFVDIPAMDYGTRTQTVILVGFDNRATFIERTRSEADGTWSTKETDLVLAAERVLETDLVLEAESVLTPACQPRSASGAVLEARAGLTVPTSASGASPSASTTVLDGR